LSSFREARGSAVAVIPETGKIPKNKVEKVGVFSQPKKHHTKHHNYHAFHHRLTTFLPPQNTQKSQNPLQKHPLPRQNIFSKTGPGLTFSAIKADRESGASHAASEVVLPYPAPQT
jgi:hypothetical protein